MKPEKKRSVWWIGGSVAAIAVIIVLLLSIRHDNEPPVHLAEPVSIGNRIIKQPVSDENTKEITIEPEKLLNKKTSHKKLVTVKQNAGIVIENEQDRVDAIVDTTYLANNNTPESNNNSTDSRIIKSDSISIRKNNKRKESDKRNKLLIADTKKDDNKWLLAASFSSGGGINLSTSSDMMYGYSPSDMDENPPLFLGNSNELNLTDFSNVNHSLPISLGISVRKDFNKYIGIETGLIYTYLSSEYKNSSSYYTHIAHQELHYLGIPVNLVVYLWNDPKWNLYFTTGVMGEKGIRFNYRQDIYKNNERIFNAKDRGRINGMQWSFNASIGVSYTFYKDWSIYFEPRYSYYFDNNQPINIRTEKPNVLGMGAGLRYKF
nr:outer membrane beta-barrel protein [Dysgonomonas sp. Marseille-P4677]